MIPKKKEGEGPGPGKAGSSIVGEYQDGEMGGRWLGNGWREEGLMNLWEGRTRKGEIIWNVNKEYRKNF